jgi:flagellar motor switch protein FliM
LHTAVRAYDFGSPEKLSKLNLRALQMLFSGLELSWSSTISTVLKSRASVRVNPVYQTTFGAYMESMRSGALMFELSSDSFPGVMLVDVPTQLGMSIADRLVGGSGIVTTRARELTGVQVGVLKCLINRLKGDLEKAWEPVMDMKLSVSGIHSTDYGLQVAAGEPMLVAGMAWNTGMAEGSVSIAIPVKPLEGLAESLNPQKWRMSAKVREGDSYNSVVSALESVKVPLSIDLGHALVTMKDVLSMEQGDVITLNTKADEVLPVRVGHIVRFHARPGLVGKRMSIQITGRN